MSLFKLLALKGTWLVVLSLYKRGPMKYSEIVKLVGYSTTANRALRALEKEAFIETRNIFINKERREIGKDTGATEISRWLACDNENIITLL